MTERYYSYRYRLYPTDALEERLAFTVDTCRQVYNHFLHRLNRLEDPSMYEETTKLPELKEWWTELQEVYAQVLMNVVRRLYQNLKRLGRMKDEGERVGALQWKGKGSYRSFTYPQGGFELKNTSGQPRLWLSKIGEIPIRYHREIPEAWTVKSVTVKREPTGEWYATFGVEVEGAPPKPAEPERCVGLDLGVIAYVTDTEGRAVRSPELGAEWERLERAQRTLARKEHGSANYERQRRTVARRYADITRKRDDFLHKLAAYYAREYDLVAVEELDHRTMFEGEGSNRNKVMAAWGQFRRFLAYKCEREGTHFVTVEPQGTSAACSRCGELTWKPVWVRTHECDGCSLEADRDCNAAWVVLQRGLEKLGMGRPDGMPAETALTVDTIVSAKRVCETGTVPLELERTRTVTGKQMDPAP